MKILITGALGLVGSEAVRFYLDRDCEVVGVDNDTRKILFGTSVAGNLVEHKNYRHYNNDICDIYQIIELEKPDVIIHAAAQPSHDWSALNPIEDFRINALGTLIILETCRKLIPDVIFVYISTNKVYGDSPNVFKYKELETRYELDSDNFQFCDYTNGFDENLGLDNSTHSPFGCSKLTGDIYTQEYAKYYGMRTAVFRCGCITGSRHAGAELHGFLSYMVKCKKENMRYKIYGYKGKQVRDNIHSFDLVNAIECFVRNPVSGSVFNMGGGRGCNISVLEALEKLDFKNYEYIEQPRKGDHIWYISDTRKFERQYPEWKRKHNMDTIFEDLMR